MAPALGTDALMRRGLRSVLVALTTACLALAAPPTSANEHRAAEADVKAAVIYNLLLFIQWPKSPAAAPPRLRLCVVDGGELTAALQSHANKTVQGRPLEIRQVAGLAEELEHCAAVAIESGNPAVLSRAAAVGRQRPLLVIAEGTTAVERGAMIGLRTEGGRMVFDINAGALRHSGLGASSQILRLARVLVD